MKSFSKTPRSKFWILLGIFAVFSIAVAACAPSVTSTIEPDVEVPATETGGEQQPEEPTAVPTEMPPLRVRAAITDDESTLNPYTYVTGFPGWNILTMQYDTLFQLDVDGQPQPWMVTNLDISADGTVYTMDLREDITWNDGEPFTAEDVKFTFEYFTENSHSRFTRGIAGFASAVVEGDYRIVVTLEAANATFTLIALADVPILPKHIWENVTDPAEFAFDSDTNVATGPFILMEYEPDQFYRFDANEDYFAGKPTIDELVLVKFADMTGALAAFRTNEVDMIFPRIPPEQVDLLGGIDGVKIAQGPEFTTDMIVYDMENPPFNELAVRQAIALAVDLDDMVDTVYLGAATAGSIGWIHPTSPLFNDSVVTEFNPDKANSILEDAGIVDSDGDGIRELNGVPLSFEFMAPSGNPQRLRLAELAREMLLNVGMDAQVVALERTTLVEAVWPGFDVSQGRSYEMAMFGWSAPVQAIPSRVTILLHSDPSLGAINITGYVSEEADSMVEELTAETDPAKREQLMRDFQELIARDLPFVLLLYPDGIYAYWSNVYDNLAFVAGQGVVSKLSFLPVDARP